MLWNQEMRERRPPWRHHLDPVMLGPDVDASRTTARRETAIVWCSSEPVQSTFTKQATKTKRKHAKLRYSKATQVVVRVALYPTNL